MMGLGGLWKEGIMSSSFALSSISVATSVSSSGRISFLRRSLTSVATSLIS